MIAKAKGKADAFMARYADLRLRVARDGMCEKGRKIKVIIATLGEGDLFLSEMNETLQVIFQ